MKSRALALALAAALATALPALAQSPAPQPNPSHGAPNASPAPAAPGTTALTPPLPALSSEQSANLNDEMVAYRQWVDGRLTRGEITAEEAQRLVAWRRWQLARQIAGLAEPEPPRVIVQREYVYPAYDPWYRPYDPWYRPYPYYFGPRVSLCAGRWGRHSFGSICF